VLEDADARGAQMNPVCGDTLLLTLRIRDGCIADSRIQTEGCAASVATSSILTELIQGLTLDEAMALSHEDVSEAVGGLPPSKLHSAALVIDALRRAIQGYRATASA
jgi:NifU-like protein involved in Fe-S cluster formation